MTDKDLFGFVYIDMTPEPAYCKEPVAFHPMHPALGVLPSFFDLADERPPQEQIDEKYAYGGGWQPFEGFAVVQNGSGDFELHYPGDPVTREVSRAQFRDHWIVVFEHAWVMIAPIDDMSAAEIARID